MVFVICEFCQDTHHFWHAKAETHVMCTHCPLPCKDCSYGAYCRETPCFCLCHKDLEWYDGPLSWYVGPLTKERLADLRHKLAKARGMLMSFLDPESEFHPDIDQIKLILKETEDP